MTHLPAGDSAPSIPAMTVREAAYDLMRRFGMTSVFANPGSTELPLFRGFPTDFRYVLGLHEAVVVGMADGHAQANRNASFVNLHSAAGVGNAMGAIFTSFKNKTPLVIVAGQQARSILPFEPFLFSSRATELPRPYVKWSVEPARAQDVPLALARGYYTAMMPPRGPVLISVPVDDWDQHSERVSERTVSTQLRPAPETMNVIGAAIDAAARPAFVVGPGVDRDGGWNEMVMLAERHNARVWGAPLAGRCSFPEDHPLFAGFLPPTREKIVALLSGHDVIGVIGAPAFTYHVEGIGPHIPAGARLYQLTDDPDAAAWTPVGVAAVGSIKVSLLDLLSRPSPPLREPPPARPRPQRAVPTERLSAAYVFQTLAEVRRGNEIVVEEAPSSRPAMQEYLPITRSEGYFTMDSGGLGYGMPAAVGVALGKPGTKIICIVGDGSSMYSIQALWSAAQWKLPITFIILNNRRYAALQNFASQFGFAADETVQGTALQGIDFVALAQGMGCGGRRVSDPDRLSAVLTETLSLATPTLLELEVE